MTADAPGQGQGQGQGQGDRITTWPARRLVHRADAASCEVAAMQLDRCAAVLTRPAAGHEPHPGAGDQAARARSGPAQTGQAKVVSVASEVSEVSVVAQALRELGAGLREYGLEMSRLAAVERGLVDQVVDEADVLEEDMQVRLHRLRSEAGRAAATIRHRADAVRGRLEGVGVLAGLEGLEGLEGLGPGSPTVP